MPLWKKILKTPGDVFVPILPAIVASGLMMGIVEAIPKFIPSFGSTDWYAFLDLIANTAFVCLPIMALFLILWSVMPFTRLSASCSCMNVVDVLLMVMVSIGPISP